MPSKKRNFRKRRPRKSRKMTLYKNTALVPKKRLVNLRYSEQVTITTAATLQHYMFRTNSLFDPNQTGGGHQPMGHDTLETLYHHYCVIGAKIRVRALNKDTGDGMVVGLCVNPKTTGSTSLAEFSEQSTSKTILIGEFGSGNNTGTLSLGWSAKKYFGKSPTSDSNLYAGFGASPIEQSYFDICAAQSTYGAYGGTCTFEVEIEYAALVFEPKLLALS